MAKASVCRRAVDLAIQSAAAIYAGLRVGEIAALTIGDVVTTAGGVRREIKLSKHQTKGSNGRTVVLSGRVQAELREYLKQRWITITSVPLIAWRRSGRAFSTVIISEPSFCAIWTFVLGTLPSLTELTRVTEGSGALN